MANRGILLALLGLGGVAGYYFWWNEQRGALAAGVSPSSSTPSYSDSLPLPGSYPGAGTTPEPPPPYGRLMYFANTHPLVNGASMERQPRLPIQNGTRLAFAIKTQHYGNGGKVTFGIRAARLIGPLRTGEFAIMPDETWTFPPTNGSWWSIEKDMYGEVDSRFPMGSYDIRVFIRNDITGENIVDEWYGEVLESVNPFVA